MQKVNYTAADIIRYHSGKMSEKEMHALEKAAIRDPFLQDAMEGYLNTNNAEKDLVDLRSRLAAKTSSRIRKKWSGFVWLRVAAMVIVISGMGYLASLLNTGSNEKSVAVKRHNIQQADSTAENVQDLTMSSEQAQPEKKNSQHEPVAPNRASKSQPTVTDRTETEKADAPPVMPAPQLEEAKSDVASVKAPVDNDGIFLKDKEVTRMISKSDTVYAADEVATNKQKAVMTNTASRSRKDVLFISDNDSLNAPVGGWKNFREYVYQNVESPKYRRSKRNEVQNANTASTVVLSFDVAIDGSPKNIKVEESLCKGCEKDAVRLLEKGPKWKYGGRRAVAMKL